MLHGERYIADCVRGNLKLLYFDLKKNSSDAKSIQEISKFFFKFSSLEREYDKFHNAQEK